MELEGLFLFGQKATREANPSYSEEASSPQDTRAGANTGVPAHLSPPLPSTPNLMPSFSRLLKHQLTEVQASALVPQDWNTSGDFSWNNSLLFGASA